MTSWPEPVAAIPAPVERSQPQAESRRRAVRRLRTANAVVWIVVATVVLAGVVALNVAVLQRNLALDRLARERAQLRAANADLVSRLASAAQAAKIEQRARRLGLVPADPAAFTYVNLAPPK